ncbi:Peptidyl-tRNA hydrolase-like protein 2 [Elsinoe fawcettii]|nr:Peptidyl-tRNA hydrolase-like protein 2 [Elsinoe fawcettii]
MPPSLLLVSLGNPGSRYALTRHNAGHIVLASLASLLGAPPLSSTSPGPGLSTSAVVDFPPLRPAKRRKPSPSTPSTPLPDPAPPPAPYDPPQPRSATWTLTQCPTLMNVSGPSILSSYRTWLSSSLSSSSNSDESEAGRRLIILHDSLEDPIGRVRLQVKGQEVSARGHNGIKSLLDTIAKSGRRGARDAAKGKGGGGAGGAQAGVEFVRLNIGIGRPQSRDPDVVADYVLRPFSEGELRVLQGKVTEEVERVLKGIK